MPAPDTGAATARDNPDLGVIAAPAVVPADPDKESKQEHDRLDRDHKKLVNRDLEQNIKQRKIYAACIFGLVFIWLAGVYVMLILEGFHYRGFDLTEKEILAAITSTTANIIAVLVIIVKYLFPNHPKPPTN